MKFSSRQPTKHPPNSGQQTDNKKGSHILASASTPSNCAGQIVPFTPTKLTPKRRKPEQHKRINSVHGYAAPLQSMQLPEMLPSQHSWPPLSVVLNVIVPVPLKQVVFPYVGVAVKSTVSDAGKGLAQASFGTSVKTPSMRRTTNGTQRLSQQNSPVQQQSSTAFFFRPPVISPKPATISSTHPAKPHTAFPQSTGNRSASESLRRCSIPSPSPGREAFRIPPK